MKAYRHRGDDSGIVAYEYGPNWIRLRFAGGNVYVYPARQIGLANLRQMKRLAKAGRGLATFVNQHPEVKNGYTR